MRTLLLLTIFFSSIVYGQSFVDIDAGITAISRGSGSWGDYDNDKDLDLLITGENYSGQNITKIYINTEGVFSESPESFEGIKNGTACWMDYDNDADLDILITGENSQELTFLYNNENGSFSEENPDIGYFDAYSSSAWGDFDNDGDQDLFLTGDWSSILYRNDGNGLFTQTEDEFTDLSSGRGQWIDIDHDQDLDLMLGGDTGGGMKLYLYVNNNGYFTENELEGMGLSTGSLELADYDADGDLDLLIMGFNDNVEPEANIYRNDGDLIFTNIYAGLPPVTLGRASWGDVDNDGDLDVAITGKLSGCGVFVSDIYENVGSDYFNSQNLNLPGAEQSYLAWGDFDNDTDLDLFICGLSYSGGPFARIYRNDMSLPNFPPEPPQITGVEISGSDVILTWESGSDTQTSAEGLYYNIRVGTVSQNCDHLSPMSHTNDGYRQIPALGNASQETSWVIKGLEEGQTYFWSVQTIDPTWAASGFSEEHSFTKTVTSITELDSKVGFSIVPNPASDYISIRSTNNLHQRTFEIFSMTGEKIMEFECSNTERISIKSLKKGTYMMRTIENEQADFVKLLVL